MRIVLTVLAIVLFSTGVYAQGVPSGPAPTLKVVRQVNNKSGEIVFLEIVCRVVPVTIEKAVIVNGQEQRVKETTLQYIQEERMVAINAAKSRVLTTDGKQLPIDEVWKRIKKDTVVAVSENGNVPAAAFMRALNANTLVIIAPQIPQLPEPPGPAPKILPPQKV